jgi:hypothetical protein
MTCFSRFVFQVRDARPHTPRVLTLKLALGRTANNFSVVASGLPVQ